VGLQISTGCVDERCLEAWERIVMKVYRVFIKEISYLDVEAESGEDAAGIAFKEFTDPDTDAVFDIMGVGVHVMPYEEWQQNMTVVH
jgi:hypothetical protein